MDIVIKLPQEIEVDSVEYNSSKREIRIKPLFVSAGASALLAYVQVVGAGGASLKSVLRISSNTGQIAVRPLTTTAAKFDELAADAVIVPSADPDPDDEEDEVATAPTASVLDMLDEEDRDA